MISQDAIKEADLASAKLKMLYDEYYPFLINFLQSNNCFERKISFPLLLKPFPEYFEADVKLMIVGQETQGWSMSDNVKSIRNEKIENRVDSLMKLYQNFKLGAKIHSPFWRFARTLNKKLNISDKAFLHNNISKVDENRTTPKWDIFHGLSATSSNSVITREFEILKPNVVVFTTGKKLDNCLRAVFKGVEVEPLNGYISRVKHPLLSLSNCYKTEHPTTLSFAGHFDKVIDFIINDVKISCK